MSATASPRSFTEHQFAFTAYIRDPQRSSVPGDIEKRRIDLYRELMFNNVEGFLSTGFPVLRRLMDEGSWTVLVQGFFSNHRCKTPYFFEISEEFLEYLQHERGVQEGDVPFMLELAHYEWVEMALALAADELPDQDLRSLPIDDLKRKYAVSPLAWFLAYRYPVHKISVSFQPEDPPDQPTYLVVYRNLEDDVKFMEINSVTYRLLQLLEENQVKAVENCLTTLSKELTYLDRTAVFESGINIVQRLRQRGIVILVD